MAPPIVAGLDSSSDEEGTSLIYAVLPPLLKRSVPKVRSLRRSLGCYNSSASALVGHARSQSADSTRTDATPPPPYPDTTCPLTSMSSDDDECLETPSTPSTPRASYKHGANPIVFSDDDRAGIRWEFASQGLSLLTLSAQGSSCLSSDPAFGRQLYVDSVSYLLRGLPHHLSDEERFRLRAALPNDLAQSQLTLEGVVLRNQNKEHRISDGEENPTFLHRTVAMVVLQFFLLFSFLWPYAQTFCRTAYQYERDHHVSERFITHSWSTANAISKNTLTVAKTVCSWNDGQVGETLEDVVFWWVQGVTGGLREGVQDGMEALGVKAIEQQPRGKQTARRRA